MGVAHAARPPVQCTYEGNWEVGGGGEKSRKGKVYPSVAPPPPLPTAVILVSERRFVLLV